MWKTDGAVLLILRLRYREKFFAALGKRAKAGEIREVRLHTLLDLQAYDVFSTDAANGVIPVSWFSGGGLRKSINEGRGDLMPCYYQDMPGLFENISSWMLFSFMWHRWTSMDFSVPVWSVPMWKHF